MKSAAIPPVSSEVRQATYCHLETKVVPSQVLRVACAGLEHCAPHYHIKRAGYVCSGLELVVRGRGTLKIGGKSFRLLPGHVFLYGPRVPHEIECDKEAAMSKYFADFYGVPKGGSWLGRVIQPGEVRRVADPDALARIFDALIEEGKSASAERKELAACYMRILLLKTAEAGPALLKARSQSMDNLNRCRSYLEQHALEIGSLEELATAMHLDPRYICRLFKRFCLPSPYQLLLSAKMSRAAERLAGGNDAVKSIAAEVGFEDPLHFSRLFRKHFGCSPSDFRNQRR